MKKLLFVAVLYTLSGMAQAQLPPPLSPPVKADTTNPSNCYGSTVNMAVPNGDVNLSWAAGSYFIWEYSLTAPTASPVYVSFGASSTAYFQFTPLTAFGNVHITTAASRYLRVKHVSSSGAVIATSVTIPLLCNPAAPQFTGNAIEVLPTTPSCAGSATGSIRIPHLRFTDSILYIVRPGTDTTFCNPITNNPPCFNVVRSGKTNDTNFLITGIPAGNYFVIIANIGGNAGTCNSAADAHVATLAPISINAEAFTHPQCFGDSNGKIVLDVSGGDSSTYRYTISPALGVKNFTNGQLRFENLPQDNYTVAFTDTCGQTLYRSFQLQHPPKVTGTVVKTVPTCASPGNGSIKIVAGYNFQQAGFNRFSYKILKDGIGIDSLINTTDTFFSKNGLTGGGYRAMAWSPNTPACTGIDESFTLPFTPLTIAVDSLKHIDCNGQTDGYVRLRSAGGSNSYIFYLKNNYSGLTIADTNGVFNNLAPAAYTAIVKNRSMVCADSATAALTINQPANIVATAAGQDIQCFSFNNGTLSATASGGNGGYLYYWEKQQPVTGAWLSYFQTGPTIANLSPGWYRSKISDSRNCLGYAVPVQIAEPDSLMIDSVKTADIPCYAGSGFITIYARGGNAPYTQQYTDIAGTVYADFTPTTGLPAGRYRVRIKDGKNCITFYPDTLTITSPPSNLEFTYTQAQVNGYHISCYGAANGAVTITASGGNGDNYSGYFYAYDNQPWQTGNVLINIPAGNRTIKVKDARGCVVSKTVLFTQPNDSLTTTLVAKTDITCFGETTGALTVGGSGGVRPYRYSIDAGASFQTDSSFNALAAGTYTVMIRDNNNCLGTITISLVHVNPLITGTHTITHVSCNGGSDGAIASAIGGGAAPYSLIWTPTGNTTSTISNLQAGAYTLKVTDAAGCVKTFTPTVTQPPVLAPVATPYPVCYGSSTGKIIVTPVGGTAPYQYSKDNGTNWQANPEFAALAQGSYTVKVKDANNCASGATVSVGVISNNPNLNFIISSNQHAQDTITMKEISWIKPDSVKWTFHPAAVVIDPNPLEPKIKFNTVDTGSGYWIRLTGHYPTCTYMVEKRTKIFPYDPNAVITPGAFNKGIKVAELFPNPNSGTFTLNVEFYKLQSLRVYITSVPGVIVMPAQQFAPTMHLTHNFTNVMNGVQPGTYMLRIVSDYDSRYILFVKQ